MNDARFLSNYSVTCEANHVKFEMLVWDSWAIKPVKILEIGQGVRTCETTLYQ